MKDRQSDEPEKDLTEWDVPKFHKKREEREEGTEGQCREKKRKEVVLQESFTETGWRERERERERERTWKKVLRGSAQKKRGKR